MPPKKQQEQNTIPYLVWNILPIICNASGAIESLKKPVNIKKTIEMTKIIQILKEKGIQKYIQQNILNNQGYNFLCQNLQQAGIDYINLLRKPIDIKKDQKKDSKKDSKKQQISIEQIQKTIQYSYQKTINQFLIFLDFPKDKKYLKLAIQNNWKIDVVVWIEEKIKQSSRLPNYELLNKERTVDDFLKEMNSTIPKLQSQKNKKNQNSQKMIKLQFLNELKKLRSNKIGDLQNTIIIQIPYLKDLQHPQNDNIQFLGQFFKKLCELTINRNRYQSWKKQQHINEMVPTIKQKIRKEVIIQQKKQDKKGGKKDPNAQPQIQIIQQIIQKRYEDIPGNDKSNLLNYNRIIKLKNKENNIYNHIINCLAISISQQTQKQIQIQQFNINNFNNNFIKKQKQIPINKINIQNIINRVPKILINQQNNLLIHQSKFNQNYIIHSDVNLTALMKASPMNRSLQFQYKLSLFDRTIKQQENRLKYSFEDRRYVQKLNAANLNSRINLQLQLNPKIYLAQSPQDQFSLLILARVNPPGRTFYQNYIFDWKVLPNFEFWQKYFKQKIDKDKIYWNYDWRNTGNLKILSKKMMPTDNTIITQSIYTSGDFQRKLITLQKDDIRYNLKSINGNYIFTKISHDLQLNVFNLIDKENNEKKINLCIKKNNFTVLFEKYPTIFWNNHSIENKRSFGDEGQVIKYLKNGNINILYPNGNYSSYQYGIWKHIRNNKKIQQQKQIQLKIIIKTDGNKKIIIRQDQTVFINYQNGDRLILFKDGTKFKYFLSNNIIQILNQYNIIIRKIYQRNKDFNIIGSGSAFAFLGQKNILERSYNGGLFQFHHPTFTWHRYIQCIDYQGSLKYQQIQLITYSDNSIIKINNNNGLITFLNRIQKLTQNILYQRWLQLFTNIDYHNQGVYDIDLINGIIYTKDKQSNIFKLSLNQDSQIKIAVSFNINNNKDDKNNYNNGYYIPQQNYFLPHPENNISPKLFLIYHNGNGQQYFNQNQLLTLKGFKYNRITSGNQSYIQLTKEYKQSDQYYINNFTQIVNKNVFQLPTLLSSQPKKINLIPSYFHNLIFRSFQEIIWDKDFKNLYDYTNKIKQSRRKYYQQLLNLRKKIA